FHGHGLFQHLNDLVLVFQDNPSLDLLPTFYHNRKGWTRAVSGTGKSVSFFSPKQRFSGPNRLTPIVRKYIINTIRKDFSAHRERRPRNARTNGAISTVTAANHSGCRLQ